MPVCLGVLCVPSSSIRVSASYVMLRAYFYRSSLTVAQSPALITLQRSLPRSPHHLLALSLCLALSLHHISSVLFFPFLKFIFVVCNTRSRSPPPALTPTLSTSGTSLEVVCVYTATPTITGAIIIVTEPI